MAVGRALSSAPPVGTVAVAWPRIPHITCQIPGPVLPWQEEIVILFRAEGGVMGEEPVDRDLGEPAAGSMFEFVLPADRSEFTIKIHGSILKIKQAAIEVPVVGPERVLP